ncbi:MAG: formimidoylglutamate deiminase [Cytophagales bacterium]|nr:formimidoylglutamate deiminase [Cytophagales bacterium]
MSKETVVRYFRFRGLLQREDWLSPAFVGVDVNGVTRYVSNLPPAGGAAIESVDGYALPGFQNAHSHAFQYAMAGWAENHPPGTDDDFWTWREEMYACALAVDPDQAEAIAAMVYAEMVRQGYTHVAEFHYLHHDKDGKPYSNLSEMGDRMVAAAATAGIRITLIPVFYQKGGFGLAPQERQRRFISDSVGGYLRLLEASKRSIIPYEHASLGFSVHSLRAVDQQDIVRTFSDGPSDLPFHLHVAEQKKEVADCEAHCGQRPMQWLLDHLPVNERFFLVHSTHLDDAEVKSLAASGACVVLCPSTEGNLGDGIFRMKEYVRLGGKWTIGTDSHIGLNPLEEFRMIDYRQRLLTNRRNTFDGNASHYLVNESISAGRKAMGVAATEHVAPGQLFDAVVYNAGSHLLENASPENILPIIIYTSDSSRVLGTLIAGKWVVQGQHHIRGQAIKEKFNEAIKSLRRR